VIGEAPQTASVAPDREIPADPRDLPLERLRGIGPARARLLAAKGIETLGDLLLFFPIRIEDRSRLVPIASLRVGDRVTVRARIEEIRLVRARNRRRSVVRARLADDSGSIRAAWFQQPYLKDRLPRGAEGFFSGVVREWRGELSLNAPEFEVLRPDEDGAEDLEDPVVDAATRPRTPGLLPVYSQVEGLGQRFLRTLVRRALARTAPGASLALPPGAPAWEALRSMHLPASLEEHERARRTLAREELFLFELGLAVRREEARRRRAPRLAVRTATVRDEFLGRLPFAPTAEQRRAITEIAADLAGEAPMRRLLQGEVGSGKTVVALAACFQAIRAGRQAALLAPTEVLAQQHARNAAGYLRSAGIDPVLLVGGLASAERRRRREAIERGEASLVVGTHALLQPGVRFARLGLVVVDEQHRFGVAQRERILGKGLDPHALVLTATPIPRTLALTLYGDLDLTVLEGLPPGRQPVETRVVRGTRHETIWRDVLREVAAGRQAYCIYPLVEESEEVDLLAATAEWQRLREGPLRDVSVGLLHGRLGLEEKDAVLAAFREGRTSVLVSTVVVEVGLDHPRATRMAIFDAERFGLTQLHQLRGRVGRGSDPARCWLVTRRRDAEVLRRLRVLETCQDGQRIAEEDLRIRGPGDVFGVRQHGELPLRCADPIRDVDLLESARAEAFATAERDPLLRDPAHAGWLAELTRRFPRGLHLGGAA